MPQNACLMPDWCLLVCKCQVGIHLSFKRAFRWIKLTLYHSQMQLYWFWVICWCKVSFAGILTLFLSSPLNIGLLGCGTVAQICDPSMIITYSIGYFCYVNNIYRQFCVEDVVECQFFNSKYGNIYHRLSFFKEFRQMKLLLSAVLCRFFWFT